MHADRGILLRLNESGLPRSAICRLAAELADWRAVSSEAEMRRTLRERAIPSGLARDVLALRGSAAAGPPRRPYETSGGRRDRPIETLTRADRAYPEALLDLALPPPVLYLRGALPPAPAIAIVGSRRADAYGREVCVRFAADLAERGLTIVSGFARGIDQTAHRGALDASGRTVAVLGCGLDVDYPRGSSALASAVAGGGAMVSEFPPEAEPLRHHFPVRNRIIAALSHGTLVVQGTERSGSLITARLALDLGRDVYAVPGRITEALSSGTNALIRDGAFPALTAQDIVDTLPTATQTHLFGPPDMPPSARRTAPKASRLPPAPQHLRATLDLLTTEPLALDELAASASLPIDRLLAELLELELGGWIDRLPGPTVRRRGDSS